MKSLHVCVQSLMCKVFCEITSCLCAIPDVQLVCDVCIYNLDSRKISIVVDFSCFFPGIWSTLECCHDSVDKTYIYVAVHWFEETLFWQGFYISPAGTCIPRWYSPMKWNMNFKTS